MKGRPRRVDRPSAHDAVVLGEAIRHRRNELGLSQEVLAHRAGIATSTLRKIESGATVDPSFFSVMALLSELGVDVTDLGLTAEDPRERST